VTNNYRDYVLSTKKKIELVATKQKDKVDAHEYKMKLQKDKVQEKNIKIRTMQAEAEKRRKAMENKYKS